MQIVKIDARDLSDAWFQFIFEILDKGSRHVIDRGSYAGQTRLEFDYAIGHITHPKTRPLIPDIPPACGIPNPVEEAYIYGGEGYDRSYIEYIMSARKEPGESYTYGERLTKYPISKNTLSFKTMKDILMEEYAHWKSLGIITVESEGKILAGTYEQQEYLNQIEAVIWTYKNKGHRNNQLVMQVGIPDDLLFQDPACLRHIDTRIQDGKLHFFVYFRSWDLWGGFPANLAGIQNLKEYMADEIGVEDGEMIVESKGLHLYGYAEELANLRCLRD